MLYLQGGQGNAEERPERPVGFAGGSVSHRCLLFYCLPETKAINLGVWGSAPIAKRYTFAKG